MDVDVKPVPVDKMAAWTADALQSRYDTIANLLQTYEEKVVALQDELQETQKLVQFLQDERANVVLAQQLAQNIVVRVVCPDCQGTGMRPADVLSGRMSKGTAFESVGKPQSMNVPVIDPQNRCKACNGQRWVIMERFRG